MGEPLPGWTLAGDKDVAAWSPDGKELLPDTRQALAAKLTAWGIPEHPYFPVSISELAAAQPPAQRRRLSRRK
jgi:hypothetical protein